MKIQVNSFKGIQPKLSNDKLPEGMAQVASDVKTSSFEIRGIKRSTPDVALPLLSYETLFEYYDGSTNNWVYFDGTVFYVRAPIADDTFNRVYFNGESGLPATGLITFTDGMTDGEIVTVGTELFEFDIAEDGVAGANTLLGTSLTVTKELCAAALAAVTPTAAVSFLDNLDGTVTVTASSHGTAGNSIVLTVTGAAHISVSGAGTLTGGTVDGLYKAFANDLDSSPWDFDVDWYLPGSTAGAAPTLVPTAGATYIAYYYTYVSRYGEEGPGSAIAENAAHTVDANCQVNGIVTPPAGHGLLTTVGTNKPLVRVYRTATDGAGGATFLLAAEADYFAEATVYVAGDYTIYANNLWYCTVGGTGTWAGGTHTFTQGDITPTTDLGAEGVGFLWEQCPADLTNLRSHPNGFFVASKGKQLYFSEPFAPWAWPEDYRIPLDANIIGLGVFGTTIVVATDGNIYTFTGPHPDSLYKQRLAFQPCLSQRAVVETDLGVMFPSKEGFQLVAADSSPANVTADWFKPEDWDDYELETMHGIWYNKAYYGWYKTVDFKGYIKIDFVNNSITTGTDYHQAAYVAIGDGIFRTIVASNIAAPAVLYISKWDASPTRYRNYTWYSPRYILERPMNFKVAQIILDTEWYTALVLLAGGNLTVLNQANWDLDPLTNWGYQLGGTINDSIINSQDVAGDDLYDLSSIGLQNFVEFNVYLDGVLKFTKQVTDSNMFKLPRGFKGKKWEWEVKGMIPIKRVTMATSTEELK